jgi:hypothetical protein
MKATKKEINEYKKEAKLKYGIETTYIYSGVTKKDLELFRKRNKKHFIKSRIKSTSKVIFSSLIDMFANLITRLLIWCGAVLSLINLGEHFLAYMLLLGGLAFVYRGIQKEIDSQSKSSAKSEDKK